MAAENVPARPAPAKTPTVGQLLLNQKDQIAAALPKHIDPDRMTRLALTELNKNPDLKKCDPVSFLGALIQCSQLGLEPGSGLGHAYLIPFGGKVTLIVGYQGMIDLALRSGKVDSIFAEIAFEGDEFRYWVEDGLQHIKHEPVFSGLRTPERAKLAYACARIKGGGAVYAVMGAEEIELIEQENRKGKNMSAVWQKHWLEMAKKTVIRRLYKILPKSVEMADVYSYTASEGGEGPNLRKLAEDALDLPPLPERKSLDELITDAETVAN
jgi:recombination protein RecT